jgi:hypothetical protein
MEHRQMAYLLEDVIKGKLNKGFFQEELWEFVKNKKSEFYDMKNVKHWVYRPCWSYNINNTECFFSIYQVLLQKHKFSEHMKRMKKSDTSYPIIIVEDDFDAYGSILDGNHRFMKLLINKKKQVEFKFISKKDIHKIMSATYT